jgi:hypothetical protein
MLQLTVRILTLCFSKPVSIYASNHTAKQAKIATPAYSWEIGEDNLPHVKVFFWVSKMLKNIILIQIKLLKPM